MAGYCFFGGTPTVLDPRGSGRAATDLTNVHEQTHRDLVNNTLYGYVLRRLRDLQQLQEQNHTKIAHVDRLIANLSGKVTRVQISCLTTFPALKTLGIARL
jgi:hypothetical protein